MKKTKGVTPVIAVIIVLGLASLAVVGIGLATDFQFSTFLGGSPIDCEGEVVTKTFDQANSKQAVINGFAQQHNETYAQNVWEKHNFRVQDGEVKYDVCKK